MYAVDRQPSSRGIGRLLVIVVEGHSLLASDANGKRLSCATLPPRCTEGSSLSPPSSISPSFHLSPQISIQLSIPVHHRLSIAASPSLLPPVWISHDMSSWPADDRRPLSAPLLPYPGTGWAQPQIVNLSLLCPSQIYRTIRQKTATMEISSHDICSCSENLLGILGRYRTTEMIIEDYEKTKKKERDQLIELVEEAAYAAASTCSARV